MSKVSTLTIIFVKLNNHVEGWYRLQGIAQWEWRWKVSSANMGQQTSEKGGPLMFKHGLWIHVLYNGVNRNAYLNSLAPEWLIYRTGHSVWLGYEHPVVKTPSDESSEVCNISSLSVGTLAAVCVCIIVHRLSSVCHPWPLYNHWVNERRPSAPSEPL